MPADDQRTLELLDTHYGGDVSRIVLSGAEPIPGDTVLEKRDWLASRGDGLRQLLLYPPYGEPRMCVDLIVEPSLPEAQAGYVIMEAMGYPHFSGSNTICTVTALLESGTIPMEEPGEQTVKLEAPAGLVQATAVHDGTEVSAVTVSCDPAYVVERDREVHLPEFGRISFDLVWSGCYYAVVDADSLGLALSMIEAPALVRFAHELCLVATPQLNLRHPEFGDTGNLSFVAFAGPVEEDQEAGVLRSPSATYVHPGVLCSCPTGTGTAARLALLADDGRVGDGDRLVTTSPSGSSMTGELVGPTVAGGHQAVRATVTGRAYTLGRTELVVNRDDHVVDHDRVWDMLVPRTG